MTDPTRITPRDIETKFREIQYQVDTAADEGKEKVLPLAVAAGVVVLVVVFLVGRRSGKRRSTVVQIRRL